MNEDELYIYEQIVNRVKMGFDDPEDIKIMIQEQVEDEGFDIPEAWINKHVDLEFQALLTESKNWTHPTDTERLALAFNELAEEHKIIALHKAGYTTSDGEGDVIEIERALREDGLRSEGYCFYHEQDLERVMPGASKTLGLAYQKVNNEDDQVTLQVGITIAEKLRQHGFSIHWNNNINQKIEIRNFTWQKIYHSGDYMYEHGRIVGMISK